MKDTFIDLVESESLNVQVINIINFSNGVIVISSYILLRVLCVVLQFGTLQCISIMGYVVLIFVCYSCFSQYVQFTNNHIK